jgi:uncharacterized membrane protein YgcG
MPHGLAGRLAVSFALLFVLIGAAPVPPPTAGYVFDQTHTLSPDQLKALNSVLVEHDLAANEQIVFALFNSLEDGDGNLDARTREVFEAWPISQKGGGNGALLAIFLKEKKAAIRTGYGLNTRLNESETKTVIHDYLLPDLERGNTYRALGLSSLEMLRALESPLIDSGRARELLLPAGLDKNAMTLEARSGTHWFVWMLFGLGSFLAIVPQLLAKEAHFTGGGWFRPRPWKGIIAFLSGGFLPQPAKPDGLGGIDARW